MVQSFQSELISKIIKRGKEFKIDWNNSQDHFIKLAENKMGYEGKIMSLYFEKRHLEIPMSIRSLKIYALKFK